ncbi:MAG TPA: MraY family glycosyltransferase [Chloroflexota bacterium]
MREYYVLFLLALLGALIVSTLATPLVRAFALRWGAMDVPGDRKIHTSPIPRLGGLAIWVGLWAAALLGARFLPADSVLKPSSTLPELGAIFGGATVILLVGMADDRRGSMTPFTKVAGQIVACSVLVALGIHLTAFGTLWIDVPLTYLWVIGLTNALNLLDNMDGLSAGATSIAGAFFFVLAVLNGQILVALLATALVGSCLGFLIYNYNPASIFMGDSGSLSLGFMLSVLGIKLQIHNSQHLSFFIAALVLSVPIFDTAFVVWRRITEGRRITQGGKDHTSHRLVILGMNQKQAVWALYGASFLSGITALVAAQGSRWMALTIVIPMGTAIVGAGWFLARVQTVNPSRQQL